jgi:hypothetical protein
MRVRATGAALLSLTLGSLGSASASPPPLALPEKELAAETYTFATQTAKFPADVREALARQLEQPQLQMADAGMPFGESDAITDPSLPGRRLIQAALGPRFAFIHFEQGGVALIRRVVLIERTPKGMNVRWDGTVSHTYRDAKELESAIRTGSLWKAPKR